MLYFSEMSVDSDRDSVIDSEDGKESIVRPFCLTLSLQIFFKFFIRTIERRLHLFPLQHSDEDSYQEEQEDHNNIKKVSCLHG